MGVAEPGDIGHQVVGELVIGQEALALAALPRAEMHLIDRHRRAAMVALPARLHPVLVGPGEGVGGDDARGGAGPHLGREGEGVALQRQQAPSGPMISNL